MLNVYEQVSRNKFQSGLIIFLFIAFVITTIFGIVYIFDLSTFYILFAFLLTLITSFTSYYYGDKLILSLNKAQPASRKEYFNFYTITENLALHLQIPTPKIYVIQDPSPNAFATGRDPDHAAICATTGLLSKLNRSQLEAVIAHEISHINNYDIRLMMIVSLLIGTLSSIFNLLRFDRSDNKKDRSTNILMLLGIILLILSPIIAKLIQLAISRRKEYLADASAVKITRQPQKLIEALTIISQDPTESKTASVSSAPLYISNPFKKLPSLSLFDTHPPIKERIQELQKMIF